MSTAMFDTVRPFLAAEFQVKYATDPWEIAGARSLRRRVFCEEQALFRGDDRDAIDDCATTIVALALWGVYADAVVGTVRIHEAEPGVWWGSRLAVCALHRRVGALGSGLIQLAVSSAHARGCREFYAQVQAQNGPLFERLHWHKLGEGEIHGAPHWHMQADLAHYPPFPTPETGFHQPARRAA